MSTELDHALGRVLGALSGSFAVTAVLFGIQALLLNLPSPAYLLGALSFAFGVATLLHRYICRKAGAQA